MKYAIIGASGFIGMHTSEYFLRCNADLDLYSRSSSCEFLRAHFPRPNIFSSDGDCFWTNAKEYSAIVYLTSVPSADRLLSTEVSINVSAAVRFFERLSVANPRCHVIYASSGGTIYGPGHSSPISEEVAANPISPYGVGKLLIEDSLKYLSLTQGVPVTILRIANPVGYWQLAGRHGFVTAAIRSALTDSKLSVFGDGSNIRDYFDVDDLCRLLLDLSSKQASGFRIFNVGSGVETSELGVVSAVENMLGKALAPELTESRRWDLKYAVLDPSRTQQQLGWSSNLSINSLAEKVVRIAEERGFPRRTNS